MKSQLHQRQNYVSISLSRVLNAIWVKIQDHNQELKSQIQWNVTKIKEILLKISMIFIRNQQRQEIANNKIVHQNLPTTWLDKKPSLG